MNFLSISEPVLLIFAAYLSIILILYISEPKTFCKVKIYITRIVDVLFNILHLIFNQRPKIEKFLDSAIVNLVYGFNLSLFSGTIIYLTVYTLGWTIERSTVVLLIYYMLEIILLFYDKAIGPIAEKSLPTPAVMLLALVMFMYCRIVKRMRFSIINILAFIRYNITNPAWLYINMVDYDNGKHLLNRGGGRNPSEIVWYRSIVSSLAKYKIRC